MTPPSVAPTIAATGTESPESVLAGAVPAGAVVSDSCSVTVLYGGSARLTEKSIFDDAHRVVDDAALVLVIIRLGGAAVVVGVVILDWTPGILVLPSEARPGVKSLSDGHVLPGMQGSMAQQPRKPLHI